MTIFEPITIAGREFKNRTVMAPMVINCAEADGAASREFRDFYLARARGGVGYMVLGGVFVHPDGRGFNRQLGIHNDAMIPGLTHLVESVHPNTRIAAQLSIKTVGRPPESQSLKTIAEYRRAFTAGALRARECGFDAVELHACHDYWLNYFLSPYFNQRDDEYGGSLENRFRLLAETVREIRDAVGNDLILGVRLSLSDFLQGGLGLEESLEIGQRLDQLGVDYLSASVGIGLTQFRMSPPSEIPASSQMPLARVLRQNVKIPVIGVGRLDRPHAFKAAVAEGHVDMAAAGRAFIADPDYVAKIQDSREPEIRPCLACNYCLNCLKNAQKVRCAVNPYIGRDLIKPEPLDKPEKLIVVGGGPAGLSAAAIAAQRGAEVTLLEKQAKTGGALNLAMVPPFKEPLADYAEYLLHQAERAGVSIQTGTEADIPQLSSQGADRILLAMGGRPVTPNLTCLDESCVVYADEVLSHKEIARGHYLVMGGGLVGLETAEHICHLGGRVTVVELLEVMGKGMEGMRLDLILDRLLMAGANLFTKTRVLGVKDHIAQVEISGKPADLGPFESVVIAAGYTGQPELYQQLKGRLPVDLIGDAARPASIYEAVNQALDWALKL